MATIKNFSFFVLLLCGCAACHIPEPRITVPAENVVRPQLPEPAPPPPVPTVTDSAQRLADDPPADYEPVQADISAQPVETAREKVKRIYTSQIGVREATGNNDGKAVEMYLRATGLGKGFSWCAAFVRWTFDSARVKTSITAWSPTAHNDKNIVWFQRVMKKEPLSGDVFTLWFASKKRIAHTGFVDRRINGSVVQTVEGNTNDAGSREGDGVYMKKRSINSLYSITRWIPD